MKKTLLLLLACCCGPLAAAHAADQVQIRFAWWGGKSRNQATLEALKAFEAKYPNIKVKAEYTGWEGYYTRLTTQLNSNTEADVIQTNWNWLTLLSKNGDGFYDLRQVAKTIGLDQYSPESLSTTTVNGKVNAIPISANVMLFYYNAASWKKAGVPFPTNWDELMQAGDRFKAKLGDDHYPLILGGLDTLLLVRSWMYQKYQQPMIDVKNRRLAWTHQQWVEAFAFYRQLVAHHVIPDSKVLASYGQDSTYEMKPWMNGQWGGIYSWNVLYTVQSQTLAHPSDLVMGPYPMRPGAKDAGQFHKSALMFSISRHTRHPQESALLLNFLLNDPAGVVPVGMERGVPLSRAGEQALRDAGILRDDDPVLAGLNQAAALPNHSIARPELEDEQLGAAFGDARANLDYGRASVEEAASNFERQANRVLRRIMR